MRHFDECTMVSAWDIGLVKCDVKGMRLIHGEKKPPFGGFLMSPEKSENVLHTQRQTVRALVTNSADQTLGQVSGVSSLYS